MSAKEEKIEREGEITESLRGAMFRIRLDNGHDSVVHPSEKVRPDRLRP